VANGLLLLTCGAKGNVIRFLYPLTIPDAQFSQALDILNAVLSQALTPVTQGSGPGRAGG
jgi:4-aminobutyrate aminotransferase